MPTYEYSCSTCNDVIEVFQSMRDAPLTTCPKCGQQTIKRLVGRGAGIIFKGSGFYETDYKRSPAKAEAGAAGGEASGAAKPAPASTPASSSGSTTSATSNSSKSGGAGATSTA